VRRFEFFEKSDREVWNEVVRKHWAVFNHPLTLPRSLNKKDVEVINMRTDVSFVIGVAHHDVVHAPKGNEREVIQERVNLRDESIDSIDENRPMRFR
jgi:hypothetical protein